MSIKTQLRRPAADDTHLPASLPPLLRRLYALRGVQAEQELERGVKGMLPWQQLDGIDDAVSLLQQALADGRRIMVVGDFDADGATSTALTVLALRSMGGAAVDYLVPNRFEDGYGLSPEVVEQAAARGAELIVTVDNGISSHAGVDVAHAKGMQVLVTDHHLPGETLPAAERSLTPTCAAAPSRPNRWRGWCRVLPDAGAARPPAGQRLVRAARAGDAQSGGAAGPGGARHRGRRGAAGCQQPYSGVSGLNRIRAGKCRPGIRALLEVANRDARQLAANDLGFALGPRLNAAGRLDDMSIGVALLLSDDIAQARMLANDLDALNQTRREIEQGMQVEALQLCDQLERTSTELPYGLAMYHPEWHQGVVGIPLRASKSVSTAR